MKLTAQQMSKARQVAAGKVDMEGFAAYVQAIANYTARKFGKRAFIAGILDELEALGFGRTDAASLLCVANQDGLIGLNRADLVSAMDANEVKASHLEEERFPGFVVDWHFVDTK
jgi:hypothetical protein